MAIPDIVLSHESKVKINNVEYGTKSGSIAFAADVHDVSTTDATSHARTRALGLRDAEITMSLFENTEIAPHVAPIGIDFTTANNLVDLIEVYKHRDDKDPYQFINVRCDRYNSTWNVGQPAEFEIHGYTDDWVLPSD